MIDIDFETLRTLGLTPAMASRASELAAHCAAQNSQLQDLRLMRVVQVHRESVCLHDGATEHVARLLPGLIRALAQSDMDLAVGDWALAATSQNQRWVYERVPPLSSLYRRDADGLRQAIVSNVDTALLVMGLDEDFNPRRLERYLALVHSAGQSLGPGDAGAPSPVVVLSKADLAARTPGLIASRIDALNGRLHASIDLFIVDGTDPDTARRLSAYTGLGQTLVVLGSSGAGKSTLTNTLLGTSTQDTGGVRKQDGRGKHTTTSRSLHCLPGGACIIDTPGLRTLRFDADESALAATFGDVELLARSCRFRDCQHRDEPDCAVRAGIESDRLKNFHKLLRETRRDTKSAQARAQQRATWKARGRDARERIKSKRYEA
jgi:ribosome biogenesis GTPase / thiamine phosphate phosphatase